MRPLIGLLALVWLVAMIIGIIGGVIGGWLATHFHVVQRLHLHANGIEGWIIEVVIAVICAVLLLFVLGLLQNGILSLDFAHARYAGVLQRIAICYGVTALISLRTRPRTQALIAAALLLGYWGLTAWVPPPGHAPGDLSKGGNLAEMEKNRAEAGGVH